MFNKISSRKLNFVSYLAVLAGLSLSSLAFAANASNSTYNQGSAISDQDLAKRIHDKIGEGYFSKGFDQVNVQVKEGAVTLTGPVRTNDDKEKVEKEVRNIDGVKKLTSQITVQEPGAKEKSTRDFAQDTYATAADDQLNQKIRDKVSRGILWDSYKEVVLNTSNGTVTLEGFIDTVGDQQKLMTELQKIDGVKIVKSNLKIQKP
jgi:osmotically-inducible protein OsmY